MPEVRAGCTDGDNWLQSNSEEYDAETDRRNTLQLMYPWAFMSLLF